MILYCKIFDVTERVVVKGQNLTGHSCLSFILSVIVDILEIY